MPTLGGAGVSASTLRSGAVRGGVGDDEDRVLEAGELHVADEAMD